MEKSLKILALIPARGGSKGVRRKNIRPLLGKSLVQRTYETALQSKLLDRIIISTDDPEIASHAEKIGLEVPFLRPEQLATDISPMIGVLLHALEFLKRNENYVPDAVMLLQPTSPLRQSHHIDKAIDLLKNNDSVCTLVQVPMEMSPFYVMKITEEGYLDYFLEEGRKIKRRQDAPKAYMREGTVYLTTVKTLFEHKNLYGKQCIPMLIDHNESLSIDSVEEWAQAEELLSMNT
jgi:CMP-N,N'-diacetyllegionaminic acid synthase